MRNWLGHISLRGLAYTNDPAFIFNTIFLQKDKQFLMHSQPYCNCYGKEVLLTKMTNKTNGISPVAAGVAGAVVGATVATAGAIALKDKKTQNKVKKAVKQIKNQAVEYGSQVKQAAEKEAKKLDKKAKSKVASSRKQKAK